MSRDLIVQDVANCVITDLKTGKVMANTKMQMTALEGTINEEDLRAGIGNGKIFKIRSEKDLNLSMRSGVFNSEWLALTQGVEVIKGKKVLVTNAQTICIEDGEYKLTGTPDGTKVKVKNEDGEFEDVTHAAGVLSKADIDGLYPVQSLEPEGVQEVEVYFKEEVTGESIEFDATKFSRKYKVELRTIAYDLDSGDVHSDIYFIFPETMPNGDFSLSLEAGNVVTPELAFSVLQPKCGKAMGEMLSVERITP